MFAVSPTSHTQERGNTPHLNLLCWTQQLDPVAQTFSGGGAQIPTLEKTKVSAADMGDGAGPVVRPLDPPKTFVKSCLMRRWRCLPGSGPQQPHSNWTRIQHGDYSPLDLPLLPPQLRRSLRPSDAIVRRRYCLVSAQLMDGVSLRGERASFVRRRCRTLLQRIQGAGGGGTCSP